MTGLKTVGTCPIRQDGLEKVTGRGVLLMRTFMDNVQYNSSGNEVSLTKYRNAGNSS